MNRFVIRLSWLGTDTLTPYVRATWDSPHGPVHTFADRYTTALAAENTAVMKIINRMTECDTPFTHLEIVRT